MKVVLQCRHCGNKMQYETRLQTITDQSKQCVYCGKSFKVRPAMREIVQK